jgi:hypothetical protein
MTLVPMLVADVCYKFGLSLMVNTRKPRHVRHRLLARFGILQSDTGLLEVVNRSYVLVDQSVNHINTRDNFGRVSIDVYGRTDSGVLVHFPLHANFFTRCLKVATVLTPKRKWIPEGLADVLGVSDADFDNGALATLGDFLTEEVVDSYATDVFRGYDGGDDSAAAMPN